VQRGSRKEPLIQQKGQEPKNRHRVMEARQDDHSTGPPQDKVGMRERSSKKKPSIQQGAGARRPFKWNEDQNGINTDEGVPSCQNKSQASKKRRATESSLLNIGAKIHPIKKGIRTSIPQTVGDEQCAIAHKIIRRHWNKNSPKTIGVEPHKKGNEERLKGNSLHKQKGRVAHESQTSGSRHQDGTITAGEEECKNRRSLIRS